MILCMPMTLEQWYSRFLWDPATVLARSKSVYHVVWIEELTSHYSLAYVEMRLLLTRLLWKFDLELMPESNNWYDQKIFIIWEKSELKIKLKEVVREK